MYSIYIYTYIVYILLVYIYICIVYEFHVQETMVQNSRLMRSVTNGLSTGGSLALAFKLLNWAGRAEIFGPLPIALSHWTFDCASFVLGLLCGIFLFFCIEAWVTLRWAFLCWAERGSQQVVPTARIGRKPLYKLC